MKEVNLTNIRKVEIKHTCYKYSSETVCSINNYIQVLNNLTKYGVQILEIKFYE